MCHPKKMLAKNISGQNFMLPEYLVPQKDCCLNLVFQKMSLPKFFSTQKNIFLPKTIFAKKYCCSNIIVAKNCFAQKIVLPQNLFSPKFSLRKVCRTFFFV